MSDGRGRLIAITYEPRLVEEAVRIAVAASSDEPRFHGERERCYGLGGVDERERAFAALFAQWFAQLGLDRPLADALDEQPLIERDVARGAVSAAVRTRDEGAELYVANVDGETPDRERRVLRIRVVPATLVRAPRASALLRRELFHIADMLDPAFGYEPDLPRAEAGPTHQRMLLDRYSTVWSTSVAGRLARADRVSPGERERALQRFVEGFPMLAAAAAEPFSRFFDGPRPSHADIVRFAANPREHCDSLAAAEPGSRCRLCGFPTYAFELPQSLSRSTREAIRRSAPGWLASDPICPQCAELYRSRCSSC